MQVLAMQLLRELQKRQRSFENLQPILARTKLLRFAPQFSAAPEKGIAVTPSKGTFLPLGIAHKVPSMEGPTLVLEKRF